MDKQTGVRAVGAKTTTEEPSAEDLSTSSGQPLEETLLPAMARRAVESYVRQRIEIKPPVDSPTLQQRAACFVSIKTEQRELRGCIGTIMPTKPTLGEELVSNAISAAMRDPRFPPVAESELSELLYSVDVLSEPEPAQFEDLDPAVYGVVVEDESGARRGLLLPDIEGIESASQQVEVAARKAGIRPDAPLRLYRFRVQRYREQAHSRLNSEPKEQQTDE